jgi:hypothetical protein
VQKPPQSQYLAAAHNLLQLGAPCASQLCPLNLSLVCKPI